MPQNPVNRPPLTPFENPGQHNREVMAKRQAEEQARKNEEMMDSQAAFQNIKNTMETVSRSTPNLPPNFVMPPNPRVGESTPANYPHGKIPIIPPPQMEQFTREQQAQDDAEREAALQQAYADVNPEPPVSRPPPQQAPARRVAPRPVLNKEPEVHPILKQLRLDLGLDNQKTMDLTIADHVWSFLPLTPEMTTLALRIAEMASTGVTERDLLHQYAAVCCSIMAIDSTPLWKVFSIHPEKEDDISYPLAPKGRIRQKAALSLLQELMTNSKLGLIDALLTAYTQEVDPSGSVKGYTEYKNEKYFKFVCPVETCSHNVVRPKRYSNENQELPYYCELHGEALVVENENGIGSLKEGLSPLG